MLTSLMHESIQNNMLCCSVVVMNSSIGRIVHNACKEKRKINREIQ